MQQIRDSEKAEGQARIYTHGEREEKLYQDRLKNVISVNDATLAEIQKLCQELGIEGPVAS